MKYLYIIAFLFSSHLSWGQCFPLQHSTDWTAAWYACKPAANPNKFRKEGHWLMIDLGQIRMLTKSRLWNFNYPDQLNSGISKLEIDYSLDGKTWSFLKRVDLPKAPGIPQYEGIIGPDFNVDARYVLLNVLETYGHACAGLSEISIETEKTSISTPVKEVFHEQICIKANIFPNPFIDHTTISVEGLCTEGISWILTDIAGRIINRSSETPLYPPFTLNLNWENLQSGIYYLTLNNGKSRLQEKLIKIN